MIPRLILKNFSDNEKLEYDNEKNNEDLIEIDSFILDIKRSRGKNTHVSFEKSSYQTTIINFYYIREETDHEYLVRMNREKENNDRILKRDVDDLKNLSRRYNIPSYSFDELEKLKR